VVLPGDETSLLERGYEYDVANEQGMTCLVIRGFRLPFGYSPQNVDLLLRIPPGYPDVPPDMYWVDPAVSIADGRPPRGTEGRETYLGRSWQRFSRHVPGDQWRSSDGLATYLALIRRDLEDELRG
jgi:hypothetical protein